jgi:hypothetical protein
MTKVDMTKETFTIDGYYEIEIERVCKDGFKNWDEHLKRKLFYTPDVRNEFFKWFNINGGIK